MNAKRAVHSRDQRSAINNQRALRGARRCSPAAVLLLFLSCIFGSAQVPTLSDFGYLHFSSKFGPTPRQAPLNRRSCVVVLADDAVNGTFANPSQFYQTNIFDPAAPNSVNGYLNEMSCGRFQLVPALGSTGGVMGWLSLTASELNQLTSSPSTATDGQVALTAAVRNGFPFASYDLNNDGTVSQDELVLLVVFNRTNRGPGQTARLNSNIAGKNCDLQISSVPETTFQGRPATVTHELCHNIGNMFDLYYGGDPTAPVFYYNTNYILNRGITLAADINQTHLDPWHKMAMGWNEPRIVSLREGGLFYLPAVQNTDPTAAVLLYDPQRGAGEYFFLEYRTRQLSSGPGFDSGLRAEGLFIWHVQQDGNHDLIKATNPFGFTGTNTTPWANWIEGPRATNSPFLPLADAAWAGGQTTPYLQWNDGSDGPARVRTRPFQLSDDGIYVEVLVDKPDNITWVDFAASGPFQFGTFDFPYGTLQQGVAGVGYGGNLNIKTGSGTPSPITITKPMTLTAYGGPVTIH